MGPPLPWLCALALVGASCRFTRESGTDDSARDTSPERDGGALGPMVGAVDSQGATVWFRPPRAAEVELVYGRDPALQQQVLTGEAKKASLATDFTVQWPLSGLEPETTYYYGVKVAGEAPEKIRSFTTFPAQGSVRDFDFVVFADARGSLTCPAYEHAAAKDPRFMLQIGDFDHRDPFDQYGEDIQGWRRMHRDIRGDMPMGEDLDRWILPSIPIFATWDDHDYGMNNGDGSAIFRIVALQAFREYYPMLAPPSPDRGIWQRFNYAQADFFVLDLRSQRDRNEDPDGAAKSMLAGEPFEGDQKSWFLEALQTSRNPWKFIISSSCWNPLGKQTDSWALYRHEQDEIVNFVRDHGIEGVIVLSGDIHSAGAIDDGTNAFFPEMSVPTANMQGDGCTGGGDCGTWSEGARSVEERSGFGLVEVRHDEATGAHTADLVVVDSAGVEQMRYRVALPVEDDTGIPEGTTPPVR